jgi:copper chaperone CopZ
MESKTFKVPNIGCDGCVRSVESEVRQIAGVQRVQAAVDSKMVTVEWVDPASWEKIVDALTEIDYPPVLA